MIATDGPFQLVPPRFDNDVLDWENPSVRRKPCAIQQSTLGHFLSILEARTPKTESAMCVLSGYFHHRFPPAPTTKLVQDKLSHQSTRQERSLGYFDASMTANVTRTQNTYTTIVAVSVAMWIARSTSRRTKYGTMSSGTIIDHDHMPCLFLSHCCPHFDRQEYKETLQMVWDVSQATPSGRVSRSRHIPWDLCALAARFWMS